MLAAAIPVVTLPAFGVLFGALFVYAGCVRVYGAQRAGARELLAGTTVGVISIAAGITAIVYCVLLLLGRL
jgi:hypothetical protein